ncbi:DUF6156 family protein [uncultured Cedecea sp.]|uniref:DUF6156 family protein n=1 Tax=uncultured Cedecea sp. TaxID=988762 RepID=UPI00262016E9|nr:DUF6156 family protein [uncultured Cedecea sp.]
MNKNAKYSKVDDIIVLRLLPLTNIFSEDRDIYGHSWIELGENESYGWWPNWPAGCHVLKGMLLGVPGDLNGQSILCGTSKIDPHHHDRSKGVVIFDLYRNDYRTSEEIKKEIRNYVKCHEGKWQWPLGLCCHSFQRKMLKDLNLKIKKRQSEKTFDKTDISQGRKTEKVSYYASFTGFYHPVRLLEEVAYSQTFSMSSYIKATFDANNKLVVIEKFIGNISFFKYEYVWSGKNKITEVHLSQKDRVFNM